MACTIYDRQLSQWYNYGSYIPRLYAHSKYTCYLPAVVYAYMAVIPCMAVVTPQFALWADSAWFTLYNILQAVPLIFALVIYIYTAI